MKAETRGAREAQQRRGPMLVVHRHAGYGEALAALLRQRGGHASAVTVGHVADSAVDGEWGTALVDGGIGEDTISRLRGHAVTVLALAEGTGPDRVGADGWVAAEQLAAGGPIDRAHCAATRRQALAGTGGTSAVDCLTEREKEVLAALAAGRSYRELAVSLGISHHTVRTHVRNLLAKLDVVTRLEAASLARRAGLVATPCGSR